MIFMVVILKYLMGEDYILVFKLLISKESPLENPGTTLQVFFIHIDFVSSLIIEIKI